MRATVTRDPEAFRARVEGWLAARPVEHNVLVTVAAAAREGTFAWLEEDGAVRAAVLARRRTRCWPACSTARRPTRSCPPCSRPTPTSPA